MTNLSCRSFLRLIVLTAAALSGCAATSLPPNTTSLPTATAISTRPAFELTSNAFNAGEAIPTQYTCDGDDISPPLQWSNPPAGTKSLVLICDDPDAPVGTWVHWVVYDLPPDLNSLPEGMPPDEHPAVGGTHGINSWRRTGYGGPCPPGGRHRYFFRLYALDTTLNLEARASARQVRQAMEGHILAQAELMGTYSRQ